MVWCVRACVRVFVCKGSTLAWHDDLFGAWVEAAERTLRGPRIEFGLPAVKEDRGRETHILDRGRDKYLLNVGRDKYILDIGRDKHLLDRGRDKHLLNRGRDKYLLDIGREKYLLDIGRDIAWA